MNYCKTCKYHEKIKPLSIIYYEGLLEGGYCNNTEKLSGYSDLVFGSDMMIVSGDTYDFWTGPNFGCVHHEPKS